MKAAVFEGGGEVSVRQVVDPSIDSPDEAILRVAACGLCGSDLRALAVPPEMVYDPGIIIGHEFAGEVVEAGAESGVSPGDRVAILPNIACRHCYYCRAGLTNLCDNFVHIGSMRHGGAAEYCSVPGQQIHRIPENLGLALAALAEPLACVLNGSVRAGWHPGKSAVIFGAGPIGLLFLLLAKGGGAEPVIVSEPAKDRRRRASELGADAVIDPRNQGIGEAVRDLTGVGADIAVDSVGALLPDAISVVRKAGKVLVFGLNERAAPVVPPVTVAYKELTIEGVYIAKGTFPLAIRLLARNELGFDRLISHEVGVDEFDQALQLMSSGEGVKVLIRPG